MSVGVMWYIVIDFFDEHIVAEKEAGRDGARSNECVHFAKYRIQRKQVIKFHELYRFT